MLFQKITLSNTTNEDAYYNYVTTEGQFISQKLIPPSSRQTIWVVAGSLTVAPGFAQFIVEDEVEGIIPALAECNAVYCQQNCCQYRITSQRSLTSWRYIDCEDNEVSGILNGGQSLTICASFLDSIVAPGCNIEILGCCPQYPPQTPSNTPTPTVTPTPAQNLPTYYYNGTCGQVINQNTVGEFDSPSYTEITFDLGTYVGNVSLSFNAGRLPEKFDLIWNNNIITSGFRSTCYDFTPQTCSVYNQTLLSLGYTEVSGSGSGTININKSSSNPQTLVVRVTSPIYPAEWDLTLNCVTSTPTPTPTPTITPTTVLRSILMFTSTTLDNVCIAGSGSTSTYYTNSSIIQVGSVIFTNPELTEFAPEGVYGIAEDEVEGIRIVGNNGEIEEVRNCQVAICCPSPQPGPGAGIPGQKNMSGVTISGIINSGSLIPIDDLTLPCGDAPGLPAYSYLSTVIGSQNEYKIIFSVPINNLQIKLYFYQQTQEVIWGEPVRVFINRGSEVEVPNIIMCDQCCADQVTGEVNAFVSNEPSPPVCENVPVNGFVIFTMTSPDDFTEIIVENYDQRFGLIVSICDFTFIPASPTPTPTMTSTPTPTSIGTEVNCNEVVSYNGGPIYGQLYNVDYDNLVGTVTFEWNARTQPERFICSYNSAIVIDTGYIGSAASQYEYGGAFRSTFNAGLLGKIDPMTGLIYPNIAASDTAADGYPNVSSAASGSFSFNKQQSPPNVFVNVYTAIPPSLWNFTLKCLVSNPTLSFSNSGRTDACETYIVSGTTYYTESFVLSDGTVIYNEPTLESYASDGYYSGEISGVTYSFYITGNTGTLTGSTLCPSPSPTPTPTTSITPTQTQTPTSTSTPTSTITPTNTVTPTETVTPTQTPTQTNTPSPTQTPTNTTTPTPTITPSSTPTKFGFTLYDNLTGETCNDYVGTTATTYYMTASTIINGNILYTDEALTLLASDGYYYEDTYAVYRVTGGTGMVLGTTFCNTCDCISLESTGGTFTVQYDDCSGNSTQLESTEDGGVWYLNVCGSNPIVISGTTSSTGSTTNCVPAIGGTTCSGPENCQCYNATGTTGSSVSFYDCSGDYVTLDFTTWPSGVTFCSLTTPVITGTGSYELTVGAPCYIGGGNGGNWGCAV